LFLKYSGSSFQIQSVCSHESHDGFDRTVDTQDVTRLDSHLGNRGDFTAAIDFGRRHDVYQILPPYLGYGQRQPGRTEVFGDMDLERPFDQRVGVKNAITGSIDGFALAA
jgi:hypothetical protein